MNKTPGVLAWGRIVNAHRGLPKGILCRFAVIKSAALALQLAAKYAQHLIFLSFLKYCMDATLIGSSKSRGYKINLIITEYVWLL